MFYTEAEGNSPKAQWMGVHEMSVNLTKTAAPVVTFVSAQDVRDWATKRGIETKSKGRLDGALVDAFNKAHKAKQYRVAMVQPARVLDLAGRKADKAGRNRPVKVRATHAEVRAWARGAGHEIGTAGRIPQAVLTAFANREAVVKA